MARIEPQVESRYELSAGRRRLMDRFMAVRSSSEELCAPLELEDYVVQSMPDVSPPKWHIGHTTWFFERVILQEHEPGFKPVDERYYFVFNSYYEAFGDRIERVRRGTLSRPTVGQVMDYRRIVTERVLRLAERADDGAWSAIAPLIELGCNHEEQHQELFVYDIKHILQASPFLPVYCPRESHGVTAASPLKFRSFEGGMVEIGADGPGFAYDNELPRHRAYTDGFRLAVRPVSCGEFLEFIEAGGYRDHRFWLSDGWDFVQRERIRSPLYWDERDGWHIWTLSGRRPIDHAEPVCHVSYYEAAAFARWTERRLPTEVEWECAAGMQGTECARGTFLEDRLYHPAAAPADAASPDQGLQSLFGDVWEWTQSAYLPYPGYRQSRDPLGEYNGKFMSDQMVLRGGSCATPRDHFRISYRNFFPCDKRWPMSGFRLADDT